MTDEELRQLQAQVSEHAQRLDALERRERGPSVEAIRAFLLLPARVKGNVFSLAELFKRAALLADAELLAAFGAAGASTPRKAWRMFLKLEGRDIEGYRLQRMNVERDGVTWCIERV
jgi:hypothetical protein